MNNKLSRIIDPAVLRIKIRKGIATLKPRIASLFIAELMNNAEAGFYLSNDVPAFRVSPILQKQMSDLGVNNQVTALMKDWLCYNISIVPQFNLYIVHVKFSDGVVHTSIIESFVNEKIRSLTGVSRDIYMLHTLREIVLKCIKDRLENTHKS
jgi:hypothetical protein